MIQHTVTLALASGGHLQVPAQDVLGALLARLDAFPLKADGPPEIGQPWPEQGGVYIGSRPEGDSVVHVVTPADTSHDINGAAWAAGCEAVKGLAINGHADWVAGSQRDLMLGFINAPHLFNKKGRYWTSTQNGPLSAWAVDVEYGNVSIWFKSSEFQVRPVRLINSSI